MKIKITELCPASVWIKKEKDFIGKEFEILDNPTFRDGYFLCSVINEEKYRDFYVWCKYIEVPEPKNACVDQMRREAGIYPSAMSEPTGLPKYCSDINLTGKLAAKAAGLDASNYWYCDYSAKPKKLSWIQKIKKYDDLQVRCNAAESMRDHYKQVFDEAMNSLAKQASIITEKSRELKLMEKVAGNWQSKLIDANILVDSYKENEERSMIGKRLKFSTHGMKFEIVIGEPFTVCKFYHSLWEEGWFSVAKRNPKDQMDWKKAAVQSVENLCKEMIGDRDIQASIFEALFAAHPELK